MNCINCTSKACKSESKDCTGIRDEMLDIYGREDINRTYRNADNLVSNGKAGMFSRLEELIRFCRLQSYKRVGIVYCYGIENLAKETGDFLSANGVKVYSYRCTLGGISENMIDESMGSSVNCNPAGQALALMHDRVDFVIEMGLCLGHDVIFHELLDVPHSVFIVKDRVHNHNPARALQSYKDASDAFIESLDSSFNMRSPAWLKERIAENNGIVIIDLRPPKSFHAEHIEGSLNIQLKDLPSQYQNLEQYKNRDIICLCNGSVQSAYAIGYLYSRGFKMVHNLSGGFSRFKNDIGEYMATDAGLS
jgi:uncharacterized metal-binding protein/rhodanese-related sulfurtransferase